MVPSIRLRRQAVRKSSTSRPRWRQVATVVSIRSTYRLPTSLSVPWLVFRQITPCRSARSAALLCGDTPSAAAKIHRWAKPASTRRHTFAVHEQAQAAPDSSSEGTIGLSPATYDRRVGRATDLRSNRRHQANTSTEKCSSLVPPASPPAPQSILTLIWH